MPLDYERIMAYRPADIPVDYGPRQCIIYALGIGIGMDPMDRGQLKFVYEKELTAFPSMGVILGRHGPLLKPEFGVDQKMMVAAALRLVLHQPLRVAAKLLARARVREVIDKGPDSAAIIEMTRELLGADGRAVATVDNSTLVRKHGGFGGKLREIAPPHEVPTRGPDAVVELPTPANLALVYRLNGDENPLHADPDRAQSVGFPRPILHGAATFGIASHAVVRHIGYRAEDVASLEARFVRPVYPGDTLRTELWREGSRISFQCRAAGRDGLVLTNGLAMLRQ